MAVRVLARVWDGFEGGGSELLAMLALADWSDDEGRCWPSIAAIAKKTRLERRQAQRIIHRLIDDGYLVVTGNETGGAPGTTRQYRIVLSRLTGVLGVTPTGVTKDTPTGVADVAPQRETGVTEDADGCHPRRETGVSHDTQTVSEPSTTVNESRAQARVTVPAHSRTRKPETTLARFISDCAAGGVQPIPETDPIFEYAKKVGLTDEMLACCWAEFKKRHLPTNQRQKDWRAHFRNAVRSNWYKFWFIRGGDPADWTTAGQQARREAA